MRLKILILSLLFHFNVSADTLIGTARNAKGEIVYLEQHEIKKDESDFNKLIHVEYKKPEGQVFATMKSDFSKSKLVPDTIFEDQRFKSKHTLKLLSDGVEFEEFKDGVSKNKKSVALKELMVASQGFDNFIRTYSSKLAAGPQVFQFGVLSNMDFYSLTGTSRPAKSPDELEYGIKASSWLIRMFASELKVTYDAKTLRLKSFAGRSNLLNDEGKSQDVIITYEWKKSS